MIDRKIRGSSFDAFLKQEGLLQICEEQAIKEIRADQAQKAIKGKQNTQGAKHPRT